MLFISLRSRVCLHGCCFVVYLILDLLSRMGLLSATTHSEEDSTQELFRELCVQAEQASDSPHEIDTSELIVLSTKILSKFVHTVNRAHLWFV
jgi:hypothetical protein